METSVYLVHKVEAMVSAPILKNVQELCSFVGLLTIGSSGPIWTLCYNL